MNLFPYVQLRKAGARCSSGRNLVAPRCSASTPGTGCQPWGATGSLPAPIQLLPPQLLALVAFWPGCKAPGGLQGSCPPGLPRGGEGLQHPEALAALVSQVDEWLENSVLEMFVPAYMEIWELTNRSQKDRNSNKLLSGAGGISLCHWEVLKGTEKQGWWWVPSLPPQYSAQLLKDGLSSLSSLPSPLDAGWHC